MVVIHRFYCIRKTKARVSVCRSEKSLFVHHKKTDYPDLLNKGILKDFLFISLYMCMIIFVLFYLSILFSFIWVMMTGYNSLGPELH